MCVLTSEIYRGEAFVRTVSFYLSRLEKNKFPLGSIPIINSFYFSTFSQIDFPSGNYLIIKYYTYISNYWSDYFFRIWSDYFFRV